MKKIEASKDPAGFLGPSTSRPGHPGAGRKILYPRRSYIDHVTAAPISLWEQDFSRAKEWFEQRSAAGINDFRRFLHEHPEEVIGLSGTIRSSTVNAAGLAAFRHPVDAQLDSCICLVTDKDSYTLLLEQLIALAEGRLGGAHEPITLFLQESGKTLLVRMAAHPGCEQTLDRVVTAVIDISSTANIQQSMAVSAEKYRRLFESAGEAMFLADAATGIIVEVNKRAELLLELAAPMVVGFPLAKFLPLIETGFPGERRLDRCETFVTRHRSREKIPVAVSTSPITCDGMGFILGIVRELPHRDAGGLHHRGETTPECDGPPCRLTVREKEILRLIASGNTSREIAEKLRLSPKTVETHRSRSMRKLHLHNTAALVKYVLFSGLD